MKGENQNGRERLQEALAMQDALYWEKVGKSDIEPVFSEKYEHYIENLTAQTKKRSCLKAWKRAGSIAASVVLLIGGLMAISPVRERAVTGAKTAYENFIDQEGRSSKQPQQIVNVLEYPEWLYILSDIPENYIISKREIQDNGIASTIYRTADGGEIYFTQYPKENAPLDFDHDRLIYTTKTDRFSLDWGVIDDVQVYRWHYGDYVFSLSLPLNVRLHEVKALVDSMSGKEVLQKPSGASAPSYWQDKILETSQIEVYYSFKEEPLAYLRREAFEYKESSFQEERATYLFSKSWEMRGPQGFPRKISLHQYVKGYDEIDLDIYEYVRVIKDGEREINKLVSIEDGKLSIEDHHDLYRWDEYGYTFVLEVPNDLTEDEIFALIHSVVEVENPAEDTGDAA